jgi:lipoate-protein ligase A
MVYIESDSRDPYYNLALEEYVFEHMDRNESYFILWQNSNTIVIGKYQNTSEEINREFVDAHGIKVARRLSGGGAVYHDEGNLNFTLIVDKDEKGEFDFKLFAKPVIEALKTFGIKAEFNGRNDITIAGKKFSGNSQYIKGGRILHHGCIMLDSNLENVSNALRVRDTKFQSKSVKSVHSRVTTINENSSEHISMTAFKEALRKAFLDENSRTYVLTDEDRENIGKLKTGKYETWEWNYGMSPVYSVSREKKFDSGLVSIYMETKNQSIEDIKIYGDFFGNGDVGELEQMLRGVKLDDNLAQTLEEFDIEKYMQGIKASDIAELLR